MPDKVLDAHPPSPIVPLFRLAPPRRIDLNLRPEGDSRGIEPDQEIFSLRWAALLPLRNMGSRQTKHGGGVPMCGQQDGLMLSTPQVQSYTQLYEETTYVRGPGLSCREALRSSRFRLASTGRHRLSDGRSAETSFEQQVQASYVQGSAYLQEEEFYLALNSFRGLQNLILTTIHPGLPPDAYLSPQFVAPLDPALVDAFTSKVAQSLTVVAPENIRVPDGVALPGGPLPDAVQKILAPFKSAGLRVSSERSGLQQGLNQGVTLIKAGDWAGALNIVPGRPRPRP